MSCFTDIENKPDDWLTLDPLIVQKPMPKTGCDTNLIVLNYLSEFKTDALKQKVKENLGIFTDTILTKDSNNPIASKTVYKEINRIKSNIGLNSISWTVDADMNNYIEEGVYHIDGERIRQDDNLPISNIGIISAQLNVIVSESVNNLVVMQILSLNNNVGGEGNIYIRSRQNGEWKAWGKLQTNIEVGVINQEQLDALIDNGIYSGILSTTNETFVIICINNYAIAQQVGAHHISHLKYSLVAGEVKIEKRTRDALGFWTGWVGLDEKSLVAAEAKRAKEAEQALQSSINAEIARAQSIEAELQQSIDDNNEHITAVENSLNGLGGFVNSISEAVLTEETRATAKENELAEGIANNSKKADDAVSLALRKLFVAAGAEYNNTNVNKAKTAPWGETVQHLPKHYYLNGLGDITENEMTEIYNAGRVMQDVVGIYNSNNKIRTNLPALHATDAGYSRSIDGRGMFLACTKLEVAILSKNIESTNKIIVDGSSAQHVFFNCPKVRYISRIDINGGTSTTNMFKLCSSLSHVEIKNLSTNLSFSDSPLIDKESILYLIQNSKAKSAITVTLHHDAYTRFADDADILAALTAKNEALAAQGGKLSLVCATHSNEVTPNA